VLIPRKIHFIWFGDAPMPAEYVAFRDGWERVNEGWEVITWDEASLPPLVNREAFDAASTWAGKADIARLEILLREGGVYADCDFEPLRPMEPLLEGVGFFAARDWGGWIANTLMGSAPGHPMMQELVDAIPARFAARPDAPPNEVTGPHLVTELVSAREGADPTIKIFPKEVFYPYPYEDRHLHHIGEDFPGACAVHHWAASWIRRRLIVAVDWRRPDECAGVIAAFCRMFAPVDPVELVFATPAEPDQRDADRVSELVASLLEPGRPAPEMLVASFEELSADNYDAAVVPTGDLRQASVEAAAAVEWMTKVRIELDGGAPRLPAPRINGYVELQRRLGQASALRA
jgi:inositol phosphorylceramide mannosyltransferase catalytic subunit